MAVHGLKHLGHEISELSQLRERVMKKAVAAGQGLAGAMVPISRLDAKFEEVFLYIIHVDQTLAAREAAAEAAVTDAAPAEKPALELVK